MHLTKDESKRLISRVSGAGAFVNAARSVLGVVRHPDDPDGEQGRERVLIHVASNWGRYAPSVGFEIESRDVVVDDGSTADVGFLKVTGEVDIGIEDVQRGADDDRVSTVDAITMELADGECPSLEVKEAVAKRVSCSLKTVERHAMKMRDDGELEVDPHGASEGRGQIESRTTTWALVKKDESEGTPPVEGDTSEGTPRHAVRVPSEDLASDSGFEGPETFGRDTPGVIEPIDEDRGETINTDAEMLAFERRLEEARRRDD